MRRQDWDAARYAAELRKAQEKLKRLRGLVAKYMASEFKFNLDPEDREYDVEWASWQSHLVCKQKLCDLLEFPKHNDGSGYDYYSVAKKEDIE